MKYYVHVNGNSGGNSSIGINFGGLSTSSPMIELKQSDYFGSLLKWSMFHSEALSEDEAERVVRHLRKIGYWTGIIVTERPVASHDDAVEVYDMARYSMTWWNARTEEEKEKMKLIAGAPVRKF